MRRVVIVLAAAFFAAAGLAFVVYAGGDDSPGGVGLGLLVFLVSTVVVVREVRSGRP